MLVGADIHGNGYKVGAELLLDAELCVQFNDHTRWLLNESDFVTSSKFSLDMAWFKECWWEMVRRGLLAVN